MSWLFLAVALAFPVALDGGNAVLSLEGLALKGERFSWDGTKLHVDGAVSVTYDELHLKSRHLTLDFSAENQLMAMSAEGEVVLERESWAGRADTLRWTRTEPWITMHGAATLQDSRWIFQGRRISFSLETEQVECEEDCSVRLKTNP